MLNSMEVTATTNVSERNMEQQILGQRQDVLRMATELFRQGPDWVTFFREIFGAEGAIRKVFTNSQALVEFERTSEYETIQNMLAKLRKENPPEEGNEPIRVITVRLPQSLHASLRSEAHDRKTSMNRLCISKLLRAIEEE